MDVDQKPSVVCEICKQRFQTMQDLKRHILELCGKRSKRKDATNFEQETSLDLIRRNDETNLPKRANKQQRKPLPSLPIKIDSINLVCEICMVKFQSIQDLKRHILSVCRHQLKRTNKQSYSKLLDVNNGDSIECKEHVKNESANGSANAMHVNDKASSYYKEKSRETVKHHGRTIQYVNIVKVRNGTIKSYNDVLQCDTTETGLKTDFKYTSMYSDLLSCKTMHCSNEQSSHDTVKCAKTDKVSIGKERVALNLNRTSISQNCHQDTLESSGSQTLNLNQLIHQLQDDEHFTFQICTKFVGINIVMIKDKSVALNDEWNYHCLECKECFYDEADLIRHDCMKRKSNHSKDDICRCADCKNLCKSASSSKQMQKISQTDFDIKCMSCLRKISEETMLEHVNMNHCNQGIYSHICKIHVQNKHRFRQRFVSNHKSYKCKKCDKYKQRMEHVRCKHTEHTKLCHVCGKMFYKHNGAFKLHLQSHDFDRPRCDHCQRTFTQRSTLRIHMTLHFGGPKFECKTCKKFFTQFQNLKCHEKKVHTADRPYRCEKCGFGAVRMSELRKHMFRHSRIKQFQCANCETTFRWRTNLSAHIRNGVCKKTL